ncbi:MAG: large subunit ribosomal protein L25 [Parcubacteria group bacterium Gr01-1014_19]|nr:MAG: large subunit ribosomal protein L25 [Parcubacteria group bacterium Gr01-1014_19]
MELAVQKREKFGKATNALRRSGLIPAELYGRGVANVHLAIPAKELRKVLKQSGENTMVNVVIDGKTHPVMIHELAHDPVTDEVTNVDLYQVRLDEKIKVRVPVEFIGESQAIKEKNGLLVKAMQELEIEALPTNIPRSVSADISKIVDIGQSVYVKDLVMADGVKAIVDGESVVATVTAKMTEEQEAALSAEVKPEDVKVETEEKKEVRDAAKAAAETPAAGAPAAEKK